VELADCDEEVKLDDGVHGDEVELDGVQLLLLGVDAGAQVMAELALDDELSTGVRPAFEEQMPASTRFWSQAPASNSL